MSNLPWIFAYGSLMWDPGVPVAETLPAAVTGWRRSFCLRSTMYRGSRERPGLVLGLDSAEGHRCDGVALRIAEEDWPEAIAAIRARELVTCAYAEIGVDAQLADGRTVPALTYVVRPEHEQYAGGLDLAAQAAMIAAASGMRGPNADYLERFLLHLEELGLDDADARALAAAVAQARG